MTTNEQVKEIDKTYTVLSTISPAEWTTLGLETNFSRETLDICRNAPMSKIALEPTIRE